MSNRYGQLLDLAQSTYTRAQEQQQAGQQAAAANSFMAAARFMNAALRELDPAAPEFPDMDTTRHIYRPADLTAEFAVIGDHHA